MLLKNQEVCVNLISQDIKGYHADEECAYYARMKALFSEMVVLAA